MKLIFCPICKDVVRLHVSDVDRPCLCGRSWGRYVSPAQATIGGKAVMIGIHNVSLLKAVGDRATATANLPITAYVFAGDPSTSPPDDRSNDDDNG